MRECGDCKMCCKLFDVPIRVESSDEPRVVMIDHMKKGTDWCPACLPGAGNEGCIIYNSRPKMCRDFYCLWVQRDTIPEQFKPSKIKCVLTTVVQQDSASGAGNQALQVNVDPDRPDAWRRLDFYAWLMSLDLDVIVVEGKKRTWLKKLRKTG